MADQSGTEFEKRRGPSSVEIRSGFAQVHVQDLPEPIASSRVDVLREVAKAGVSIDFLKFTQGGLSFVVPESFASKIRSTLDPKSGALSVQPGRSIVYVHAVNMRDEEGLNAQIIARAITAGARIDHLSDMHDRALLVVNADDAESLAATLRRDLMGAS